MANQKIHKKEQIIMNQLTTSGIILAAVAAITIFADYCIDAWFDFKDRAKYRRQINPENIEISVHELLDIELRQLLREEKIKEKTKAMGQHPSTYRKPSADLNNETKEILTRLTESQANKHRNQKWWGD
jgi:hypothetical protein